MKVRSGFVSNSSTTSFTIAGIGKEKSEILKIFSLEDEDAIYDLEGDEVCVHNYQDAGIVYVGINIYSMKNDETMAQFLARAETVLSKKASKPITVDLITDGWRDGQEK